MTNQVKSLFCYFLGANNKFRFQAKIIHWGAETNNHHVYADDLHDQILNIEDYVAEIIGGIYGTPYNFEDFQELKEAITELKQTSEFADIEILKTERDLSVFIAGYLVFIQKFLGFIPDDVKFAGLKSEFETLISELNVLQDLSRRG